MSEETHLEASLPSEEAFKQTYCDLTGVDYDTLGDLRIIQVYKTSASHYMIAFFLYGRYEFLFLDKDRLAVEWFRSVGIVQTDQQAKSYASRIATMIGATLLDE